MISAYNEAKATLRLNPRTWLITGVAGFIGANLLEALLQIDQSVVGLDNFATGHRSNLREVQDSVSKIQWARFSFIEGDICDPATCFEAVNGVDLVLHQAALGSVPRSLKDPVRTNEVNVSGFLNVLVACRDAGVRRLVYAASSSTYGDHAALPKVENVIGRPLSPYAVTKVVNELYAEVFSRCYGLNSIGLRYFNVFGARQDPAGAYAAVIPRWINAMIRGDGTEVFGDGETSRDFCYVANVVQANILAATTTNDAALNEVYNVAAGQRTTLRELHALLADELRARLPNLVVRVPVYSDFRSGDVRHSLADISKVRSLLSYEPTHSVTEGLRESMPWYLARSGRSTG